MLYSSTRNGNKTCTAAQAIVRGLAEDGGLFTPVAMPKLAENALADLAKMTYQQRAAYVMGLYLSDFSQEELMDYATAAYGLDRFDTEAVAPVKTLDDTTHCLELWHGPTCAFKDMALQMLPHLLTASLKKTDEQKTVCILVATSGDTGKGALEGFRDVAGTRILVFYPKDGVSDVQETQMVTQEGDNVGVCAIYGNFDDAQTGVKQIFSDVEMAKKLEERGFFLASANSINWGRVLPQVVYYVSAYCDLVRDGKVAIQGWLEASEMGASELFNLFVPHGLKHIITTDISRDGMMCGAATELYKQLGSEFKELNIIASGGISRMADIVELDEAGVGSVIVGKALYEGGITFKELRECLQRG